MSTNWTVNVMHQQFKGRVSFLPVHPGHSSIFFFKMTLEFLVPYTNRVCVIVLIDVYNEVCVGAGIVQWVECWASCPV